MEAVEIKSVLHRVLISVIGIYDAPDFCFFSFWYRNKMIRAHYGGNIFLLEYFEAFIPFLWGIGVYAVRI